MLVSVFTFYIAQSLWGKNETVVEREWATQDSVPSC